jgi:hypothetical protein
LIPAGIGAPAFSFSGGFALTTNYRTIPTCEPTEIIAGDTVAWTKTLGNYPAADWTLKYRLIGASVDSEITATEDGETFEVTIPASTLAAVVTDTDVRMIGWVENSDETERYTVYDDYVRVRPNVATATATNLKTHAVRTLEVIEAAIEDRLTADMQSYSIDGRAVTKIPALELMQLRGIYRAKVWREQNEGESHPTHAIEFSNAQ